MSATINQAQRLKAFFEAYDADEDGFLALEELLQLFGSLSLNISEEQLRGIYAELALDWPHARIDITTFSRVYIRAKRIVHGGSAAPSTTVSASSSSANLNLLAGGLPQSAMTHSVLLAQQLQEQQQKQQQQQQQVRLPADAYMLSTGEAIPMTNMGLLGSDNGVRKSAVIDPLEFAGTGRSTGGGGAQQQQQDGDVAIEIGSDAIEDYYYYSDDDLIALATGPNAGGGNKSKERRRQSTAPLNAIGEDEETGAFGKPGTIKRSHVIEEEEEVVVHDLQQQQQQKVTTTTTTTTTTEESKLSASKFSAGAFYDEKAAAQHSDSSKDPRTDTLAHAKRREARRRKQVLGEVSEGAAPKSRQGRRYRPSKESDGTPGDAGGHGPGGRAAAGGYLPLKDTFVRKQLKVLHYSEPYFLCVMLFLQAGYLAYMVFNNGGIEKLTTNPFAGPSQYTLIGHGAIYAPCMRVERDVSPYAEFTCNPRYTGLRAANGSCTYYNNVYDLCTKGNGPMPLYPDPQRPGQWYRLLSALVTTQGVADFFFNFVICWRLGFPMEKSIGWWRMAILWTLGGVAAGMMQVLFAPGTVMSMATSASFTVIGFSLVDLYSNYYLLFSMRKSQARLWLVSAVALGLGVLPMIPNFANIGGFLMGVFGGLLMQRPIYWSPGDQRWKNVYLRAAGGAVALGGLGAGLAVFFTGRDASSCQWCKWIECVPAGSSWCGTATIG